MVVKRVRFDAYCFAGERTVGLYFSRERLNGRWVYSIGVNLWRGSVYAVVRP